MKRHHYAIVSRPRFILFCASVLLCCVLGGYVAGATAATNAAASQRMITQYTPKHFANQRD